MAFFSPFRALLKGWLLSFAGWALVAFLLGASRVLEGPASLRLVALEGLRDWLPWALLTPLIFRLVARLPIERQRWKVALPVHLACALAVVAGCHAWANGLARIAPESARRIPPPPPRERPPPPPPREGFAPAGPPPVGPPPPPAPDEGSAGPPPAPAGPPPLRGPLDLRRFGGLELPIYLMLLSAAHAALFFRRDQERAASLAHARLDALRMQLQPHFLFNTLNLIAGLVHEDPDRAEAVLASLAGLLRMSLATSTERELPLARELEFIRGYLEIMHARFEEKLEFQLEIAPAAEQALVPSFLLQPLIEHAVQHALDCNRRGALVTLGAAMEGLTLRLRIADNGIALPETEAESLVFQHARGRLRELYGAKASLTVQQAEGCTIEITLPVTRPRGGV